MGAWSDLLDTVRPLDLIMTWGRSSKAPDLSRLLIQEGIEGLTRGGPSHVRLYVGEGRIWEVTYPVCRYGVLAEIDLRECDVEVGYHDGVESASEEQRRLILLAADRLVSSRYDVGELIEHLFDELGLDTKDHSDPARFVCSSGVEYCFRKAGLGFCPEEELVSPEDIRLSPHYRVRWQWGNAPRRGKWMG